jgi:hypothetical protein
MRELLQIFENVDRREVDAVKAALADKIKTLPPSDESIKTLREIEDILRHVHAGGKLGYINTELGRIQDPTVLAAQRLIARYVLSLDMTPEQRDELFRLWREDKLVDRKKLLSGKKLFIGEIITGYDTNSGIKELVDDLMRIAFLGQGKGEFGLSVLSKNISKQEGKGDLLIDGKDIEVKTTDSGAARFSDQEVTVGPGYEQAAIDLNSFLQDQGYVVKGAGLNLPTAVTISQGLNPEKKPEYIRLVDAVISKIFQGENVKPIVDAIESGNLSNTLKFYAETNFNYYISKKKDEGVLYIGLDKTPPMFVFFRKASDLVKQGLRLHISTAYITNIKDVRRMAFPQTEIKGTTRSASGEKLPGEEPVAKPRPVRVPNVVSDKPVDIRPPGTPVRTRQKRSDIDREKR